MPSTADVVKSYPDGSAPKRKVPMPEPRMFREAFLAVLTAAHMGYTRTDGVHIVPIGCLKD